MWKWMKQETEVMGLGLRLVIVNSAYGLLSFIAFYLAAYIGFRLFIESGFGPGNWLSKILLGDMGAVLGYVAVVILTVPTVISWVILSRGCNVRSRMTALASAAIGCIPLLLTWMAVTVVHTLSFSFAHLVPGSFLSSDKFSALLFLLMLATFGVVIFVRVEKPRIANADV